MQIRTGALQECHEQLRCDGSFAAEFGTGIAKDVKRAIDLYQIACKANDTAACAAATLSKQ